MQKIKPLILTAIACTFSAGAAYGETIDFIDMADPGGAYGESAWDPLTLSFADFTLTITATNGDGTADEYAYLDKGNAGLGVCTDLTATGDSKLNQQNPGSGSNLCNPASDDNVTNDEALHFTADVDIIFDNIWFNNNHDGGFLVGDMVLINGVAMAVSTGYAGGPNGLGSFLLAAGDTLTIGFSNQQFYVSAMEIHAVPEPGTLALLGIGLIGMGMARRRKTV